MIEKVIFYDADFLSAFLYTNETSFLKKIFTEIIVPYEVYEELTVNGAPKEVKEGINQLKNEGLIKIIRMKIKSVEHELYRSIKNGNLHKKGKLLVKVNLRHLHLLLLIMEF